MAKETQFVEQIANINEDFPKWYTDVVMKTKLVDYGPVKGTMVIRPYGYAIWENIQKEMNARFKTRNVENAYFPLLIPMSYFTKEAEHVEGFAPEVAVVTVGGGETLAEPLAIRPTSETIIGSMMSKWIQSYRDLPMKINQWCNVMRWEKTTRPFLRTSEFLWQEGHTVHASAQEAEDETMAMLGIYKEFAENCLAIPVLTGRKTEKERFAGAVATYTMEAMMRDGKSLQAGTTHHFGQKFSKAYDIQFLDKDGTHKYAWQTSWGVSTRLIGAIIMAHGDQRGLVLPPQIAPIQTIVIPVASHKPGVIEKATEVVEALKQAGIRAQGDFTDQSPGWKFNQWEMKGVPVRLELGPRDIENGVVMVSRRDTFEKFALPMENLAQSIKDLLAKVQEEMYQKSLRFRDSHVKEARNMDELKQVLDSGCFAKVVWDQDAACEAFVKQELQATVRVMLEEKPFQDVCTVCQKPSDNLVVALIARAY